MKSVAQLMKTDIVSVSPQCSIQTAIDLMRERNVGAILITENYKLLGIFTERDIITKVLNTLEVADLNHTPVSHFMSTNLTTAEPERSCEDMTDIMRNKNIRHLPVVDGDHLLGILSLRDLLWYFYEELMDELLEQVREKVLIEEQLNQAMQSIQELRNECNALRPPPG